MCPNCRQRDRPYLPPRGVESPRDGPASQIACRPAKQQAEAVRFRLIGAKRSRERDAQPKAVERAPDLEFDRRPPAWLRARRTRRCRRGFTCPLLGQLLGQPGERGFSAGRYRCAAKPIDDALVEGLGDRSTPLGLELSGHFEQHGRRIGVGELSLPGTL